VPDKKVAIVDFKKISCRPEPEYKLTIESLKFELYKLLKNDEMLPQVFYLPNIQPGKFSSPVSIS